MEIRVKTFDQLSTAELYAILRLRGTVFTVEQQCLYQDLDDKDQKAVHIMGLKQGELMAYARIFKPGVYKEKASMGRVAVSQAERGNGYGRRLVEAALVEIAQRFKNPSIEISAQAYLTALYEDFGFVTVGTEYLEEGLPHIRMVRVQ